jgi:hypothetical protein
MQRIKIFAAFTFFFLFSALAVQAQDKADRPSPPRTVSAQIDGSEVVIDYSSPGVKGRAIWGKLVPYDKIWRTGANEATTIMLENDMKIEGKTIPAGKYALFTIPGEKEWVVILNGEWDQWGAYNYDESKDIHRFTVTPMEQYESEERLKFEISEEGKVSMKWEKVKIAFDIEPA